MDFATYAHGARVRVSGRETSTREWSGDEYAWVAGGRVRVSGRQTSTRKWPGGEYACVDGRRVRVSDWETSTREWQRDDPGETTTLERSGD